MRRIRLRTGPAALFGGMLLIALIVFLPMRAVLGWAGAGRQGLVAREVEGSIWDARLRDASLGQLPIGDVDARLSPLGLLTGRAVLTLERDGAIGVPPLSARAYVSRHGMGVERATARIGAGALFQPLPVAFLDLADVTIRFRDDQCSEAQGRVTATLAGDVAGVGLPPSVSGDARCDAGALVLPLTGAAGTEGVTLRITGDGRYRAELVMQGGDATTIGRLQAAGFVAGPRGYQLSVEGRF